MERPNKKDYAYHSAERGEVLDGYHDALEKYVDYLENIMEEIVENCTIDARLKGDASGCESIPVIDPDDIESRHVY